MLTSWLNGPTEINIWHGVADRCRERGVNLICFSGGIPNRTQQYEYQKNILFNFPGPETVNGLLIWTNILSHTLDRGNMEAFCLRYSPLPLISMGVIFPSIPSIRIDMREGMQKLLTHLIEEHGRRKIAFIRGPEVSQDAEDRYRAYCETLSQYGLPLDPALVVPGDFRRDTGIAAIQHLLAARPSNFDAVVSANDNMAIGVMHALQDQGMHIPGDVIVAGFDDIEETRAVVPTLTTVRAPWQVLGSKSVDMILEKIAGESLPGQIILHTELVCRQSCGCQPLEIHKHLVPPHTYTSRPLELKSASATLPSAARSELLLDLEAFFSTIDSTPGLDAGWSQKLVDAFISGAKSGEAAASFFSQTLEEALSPIPSGSQLIEWQEVLDIIQAKIPFLFQLDRDIIKAHELLENGYNFLGVMAHRRQLNQRLEAQDQTDRLNRIIQTMSTIYDIESLMELLAIELPGLGIRSCFLSLYDEKGDCPTWSRLVLAFTTRERIPIEVGGIRFPTRQLVPAGMFPKDHTLAFDVEALYFQKEQIGFVLFEIGPRNGDVYTALRGHISSALKSARLILATLEAEEKAVKADQLKSRLLANVSHELRTPLNNILGLCQIALSSSDSYGTELPVRLVQDLEYISRSGEHLVRLINDLLDMSRAEIGELDLFFESVSPRPLLEETFAIFKNTAVKQKEVELTLAVPEHLPLLYADPIRLRQIMINLLSNALKFTQHGNIVLGADVQIPHLHFWVADTGSGISPELQEKIFEPFVKVELPDQHHSGIGLGLSITRRLVALHGGSITLDSQPGAGSTFHVYIPLPGVNTSAAGAQSSGEVDPGHILLWISSNATPAQTIINLCQRNGLEPRRVNTVFELETVLSEEKPAAFAWDLDHTRPGDWSIVQKLRSYPQYCQLPLLLYQENAAGKLSPASRLTNVLLKPAGKQALQHILDLLPQAAQQGEIWIIDDDLQSLKYYQELVEGALPEFQVRAVNGGKEALNLLAEATPDLVILDLMMPEVDGFQVLEHLRTSPKTALAPVIILTGKMLTYEDVKRLDFPQVALQTKGILSDLESVVEVQQALTSASAFPQPTGLLVKQVFAHIQQNYTRDLSLKELADTMGVSKSYLSRIFKMGTGISLWDYLNRFRVQKAKELLISTSESITRIAAEVGYDDMGYFARVFRKIVGSSPRDFRQNALLSRLPGSSRQ